MSPAADRQNPHPPRSTAAAGGAAARVPPGSPHRVGFLLLPPFGTLVFAALVDVLRVANRLAQRELYAWRNYSVGEAAVATSAGLVVACSPCEQAEAMDLLLVVSGSSRTRPGEEALHAWLRRQARRGCRLGGVSLGSYVLARAGLLDGYRCTVHWENLEPFREQFPQLPVTPEVYEIDRDRLTCSGGTGALDLMLSYVGQRNGAALARAVADVFIHERIRDDHQAQRMPLRTRLGVSNPRLLAAIEVIEKQLDRSYSSVAVAEAVGLSNRQLERLFRKHLNSTPRAYHLGLRLKRARTLLRQTSMDIIDVAMTCGFGTASHFTKSYREHFDVTPGHDRRAADE